MSSILWWAAVAVALALAHTQEAAVARVDSAPMSAALRCRLQAAPRTRLSLAAAALAELLDCVARLERRLYFPQSRPLEVAVVAVDLTGLQVVWQADQVAALASTLQITPWVVPAIPQTRLQIREPQAETVTVADQALRSVRRVAVAVEQLQAVQTVLLVRLEALAETEPQTTFLAQASHTQAAAAAATATSQRRRAVPEAQEAVAAAVRVAATWQAARQSRMQPQARQTRAVEAAAVHTRAIQ